MNRISGLLLIITLGLFIVIQVVFIIYDNSIDRNSHAAEFYGYQFLKELKIPDKDFKIEAFYSRGGALVAENIQLRKKYYDGSISQDSILETIFRYNYLDTLIFCEPNTLKVVIGQSSSLSGHPSDSRELHDTLQYKLIQLSSDIFLKKIE